MLASACLKEPVGALHSCTYREASSKAGSSVCLGSCANSAHKRRSIVDSASDGCAGMLDRRTAEAALQAAKQAASAAVTRAALLAGAAGLDYIAPPGFPVDPQSVPKVGSPACLPDISPRTGEVMSVSRSREWKNDRSALPYSCLAYTWSRL